MELKVLKPYDLYIGAHGIAVAYDIYAICIALAIQTWSTNAEAEIIDSLIKENVTAVPRPFW